MAWENIEFINEVSDRDKRKFFTDGSDKICLMLSVQNAI